jgi:hypothetical protein
MTDVFHWFSFQTPKGAEVNVDIVRKMVETKLGDETFSEPTYEVVVRANGRRHFGPRTDVAIVTTDAGERLLCGFTYSGAQTSDAAIQLTEDAFEKVRDVLPARGRGPEDALIAALNRRDIFEGRDAG